MSLGSDFGNPGSLDAIATDNASLAGTTVVASSGNAGPSAYVTGSPGVRAAGHRGRGHGCPASRFPARDRGHGHGRRHRCHQRQRRRLPVTGRLRLLPGRPQHPGRPRTRARATSSPAAPPSSYAYNDFQAGRIAVVQRGFCARIDKAGPGDKKERQGRHPRSTTRAGCRRYENAIPGVDHPVHRRQLGRGRAGSRTTTARPSRSPRAGTIANGDLSRSGGLHLGRPRPRSATWSSRTSRHPACRSSRPTASTVAQGKTLGGTSMAAPAVAGVAALVKQAHPGWQPRVIKAAIIGTASSGQAKPYDLRFAGRRSRPAATAVDTKAFVFTEPGIVVDHLRLPAGRRTSLEPRTSFSASTQAHHRNTSSRSITYDLTQRVQERLVRPPGDHPAGAPSPCRRGNRRNVTVTVIAQRGERRHPAGDSAPVPCGRPGGGRVRAAVPVDHHASRASSRRRRVAVGPVSIPLVVPWQVVPRAESTRPGAAGLALRRGRPAGRCARAPSRSATTASTRASRMSTRGASSTAQEGLDAHRPARRRRAVARPRRLRLRAPSRAIAASCSRSTCSGASTTPARTSTTSSSTLTTTTQADVLVAAVDLGLVFGMLYGVTGSVDHRPRERVAAQRVLRGREHERLHGPAAGPRQRPRSAPQRRHELRVLGGVVRGVRRRRAHASSSTS